MTHNPYNSLKQHLTPDKRGPPSRVALLLSLLLAAGCGGVAPEEEEGLLEDPPQSSAGVEDNVSAETACCYAKCADGADNRWRGPFPNVSYGNCANWGKYYCTQRRWSYMSAKWANC